MEQTLYKIGEVSARLGLADKNNNTLRSWTEEFGAFLSALANPPAGQLRRYTEQDLHVLTAVREYRAHHLSYDEIRERLGAGAHTVTRDEPEPAEPAWRAGGAAAPSQGQALALAQLETALAPLAASVEEWRRLAEQYRTRLEAREARIDLLERRIEDLYTRLDATGGDASPHNADGPNGANPSQHPAPDDSSPDGQSISRPQSGQFAMRPRSQAPSSPDMRARSQAASEPPGDSSGIMHEETPPIFPLPVVARTAAGAAENTETPIEAPRRAWWRLWRS